MAGNKNQSQEVVANIIIESWLEIRHGQLSFCELAAELFMLALQPRVSSKVINGAMLRGGHQPRARIIGDSGLGPLLQRRDRSVLREVFRQPDVAHHAHEASDQSGRLDFPDRVNRAMGFRCRHGYPSNHQEITSASRSGATWAMRRLLVCAGLPPELLVLLAQFRLELIAGIAGL